MLLQAKGDLAAAEPLLCEALEGLRVSLGDRHPHTLISIDNMTMFERQLAAEVEEPQAEAASHGHGR